MYDGKKYFDFFCTSRLKAVFLETQIQNVINTQYRPFSLDRTPTYRLKYPNFALL